jgi:CBS domain containing-hemolysin-like protein
VDTIAGWLYSQLNEEVGTGKAVMFQGYLFTISELESHRITRVGITYVGDDDPASLPEHTVLLHAQS